MRLWTEKIKPFLMMLVTIGAWYLFALVLLILSLPMKLWEWIKSKRRRRNNG